MLASLGVIDSLLTSIVADNITNSNHLSNKEPLDKNWKYNIRIFWWVSWSWGNNENSYKYSKWRHNSVFRFISLNIINLDIIFFRSFASMIPLAILSNN